MFSKVGQSNHFFSKQNQSPSMFSKNTPFNSHQHVPIEMVGKFLAKKPNDLEKVSHRR